MIRKLAPITFVLVPLACDSGGGGGVSGPPVSDQDSAAQGFSALSDVLGQIGTGAPPAQQQLESGTEPEIQNRNNEIDVDVELDCPEGGTMAARGSFVQGGTLDPENPTAGGSLDISFDYSMSFAACAASGVTIDGGIDYALDVEVDTDSQTYNYNFTFSGKVGFSGAVEGTCSIDATGQMSSSGGVGGATGEMSYEGTICGYDAGELEMM